MMLSIQITKNFLISPTPSERHFAKNSILAKKYPPYSIVIYMYTCTYIESSGTGVGVSICILTKTVITGRDLQKEVILLIHTILSLSHTSTEQPADSHKLQQQDLQKTDIYCTYIRTQLNMHYAYMYMHHIHVYYNIVHVYIHYYNYYYS